jgi:hypothetical protein
MNLHRKRKILNGQELGVDVDEVKKEDQACSNNGANAHLPGLIIDEMYYFSESMVRAHRYEPKGVLYHLGLD